MVFQDESDKDRRTSKASTITSVNQPSRKDGAGSYAWGTATEVTDYEPVGYGGITQVSTMTVPQSSVAAAPAQPFMANVKDFSQFPSVGGQQGYQKLNKPQWGAGPPAAVFAAPPMVQTMAAPTFVQQAPAKMVTMRAAPAPVATTSTIQLGTAPVIGAPPAADTWYTVTDGQYVLAKESQPVILSEESNRAGVSLGQQQPRNTFARKPRTTDGGTEEAQQLPAIDWSSSGNTTFVQQALQVSGNPAHLTQYTAAQAQPKMTMQQLVQTPAQSGYMPRQMMQPSYQAPQSFRSQGVMMGARGGNQRR